MPSLTTILLGVHLLVSQDMAATAAVRGSAPLPGSIESLSSALGFGASDPSTLVLRAIRLVHGRREAQAQRARSALSAFLRTTEPGNDRVPLPLTPELWTDVILETRPDGRGLVSAILQDRTAALVYYGLSALDDETLRWVSTNRGILVHFRKHPEIFAAFGRCLRVHDGRVSVAGGSDAEALWKSVTGADPSRPDAFVERVFSGDGRLAFFYDVIAHLDEPHQRFALGLRSRPATREARLRSLLAVFSVASPEWKVAERPFSRPPFDGAIVFSTIEVTTTGDLVPPMTRRLWDRVFRGDDLNDVPYEEISETELRMVSDLLSLDAPWLAERILRVPYAIGRRRLDTLLFAQRVFAVRPAAESASVATALRGYLSFPALMIALERIGTIDPDMYVRAAQHAARLNGIQPVSERRTRIAEFQSAVALISRVERLRGFDAARGASLLRSLCDIEVSSRTPYDSAFAMWFRDRFLAALPKRASLEETLVAAVAGLRDESSSGPIIEWEGRRYRVNPAAAEFTRILAIRQAQQGPTLDAALSTDNGRTLSDALVSIVYAIHLGDPEGPAVTSSNVALRHDFGLVVSPSGGSSDAWHLPIERFDTRKPWRVRGSILGLEMALARMTLRRIDRTAMPGEPTLGSSDRQTLMLTAALSNPLAVSDESRDAIASAIAQGRSRVAALAGDQSQVSDVADAAGFSEWRRQALAWSLEQRREVLSAFSLLELFWLGAGRSESTAALHAWGAAAFPLTGCLCLRLPSASPWEQFAGYGTEVLATRAADVPLKIAETLSMLKLPAVLAPALAGLVTQDVFDHARLGYPDDWEAFSEAVLEIPAQRISDYVAALTVLGPLIEIK